MEDTTPLEKVREIAQRSRAKMAAERAAKRRQLITMFGEQCEAIRHDFQAYMRGRSQTSWTDYLLYEFKTKEGQQLTLDPDWHISRQDLEATEGFRALQHACDELGIQLELLEAYSTDGGLRHGERAVVFFAFDTDPKRLFQIMIAGDQTWRSEHAAHG